MGNEYGWRKERLRAEVLRRFWRTSIFITCSTCGSKRGVESERTVMSSSCDSQTISWLDSRAKRMPNSSGRNSPRMRKFNLELHPEKTRLLEFGRFAIQNRQRRGEGKPETFNFLGFTHICVKKRSNGMYTV